MVTAVDTNVLLDVFLDDPQYREMSFSALSRALSSGSVVVSEVVWAETGAAFVDRTQFESVMDALSIRFVPMPRSAATKASELWSAAKKQKSIPPRRVVADFLVGAHALECADCLLTRDKGFYRGYFEGLAIVEPS